MTSRIATLLAAILLTACATAGPKFAGLSTPAPDQGDIYLYRASSPYGIGQAFDVTVDGRPAGRLVNASYLHLRLAPGTHTVVVAPGGPAKPMATSIVAKAGTTQFFQWDFEYNLLLGTLGNADYPKAALHPRDRERALSEMQDLGAAPK